MSKLEDIPIINLKSKLSDTELKILIKYINRISRKKSTSQAEEASV